MAELVSIFPLRTSLESVATKENPHDLPRSRKWEIAVGIPIKNTHFIRPKNYVFSVDSVITAKGYSKITLDCFTAQNAWELYYGFLGSKNQNYRVSGQIATQSRNAAEKILIGSFSTPSGTTIQLTSKALLYNYSGSTLFTTTLPVVADGWNFEVGIEPKSLKKQYVGQVTEMINDFYAQEVYLSSANFDETLKSMYLDTDISGYYFPPRSEMRVGCSYNVRFEDSNGFEVSPPSNTYINLDILSGGFNKISELNVNAYGDIYTVLNSGSFAPPMNQSNFRIGVNFVNGSGSSYSVRFWLDQVWAEYDYGLQAGGKLLIDDYPIRSSLGFYNSDDLDMVRMSSGDYYLSSEFSNPSAASKWYLESEWRTLNSVYNYFKVMEDACKQGHVVNIHPKIPEMPEVLTGKIVVKDMGKYNFAFNRVNFKVLFFEV